MPKTTAHPPAMGDVARECEWTPSLAECLARVFGIDALSEAHWRVISECREERASRGSTPGLETLAARAHMSVAELEALFPAGHTAFAWILAGVIPPLAASSVCRAPDRAGSQSHRTDSTSKSADREGDGYQPTNDSARG